MSATMLLCRILNKSDGDNKRVSLANKSSKQIKKPQKRNAGSCCIVGLHWRSVRAATLASAKRKLRKGCQKRRAVIKKKVVAFCFVVF